MQRLLCRLLVRLYDRAEQNADSIEDMDSLARVFEGQGGLPPALLTALQCVLSADDLDRQFQV